VFREKKKKKKKKAKTEKHNISEILQKRKYNFQYICKQMNNSQFEKENGNTGTMRMFKKF
jgi:SOS response regulatory protein OraA/RecX